LKAKIEKAERHIQRLRTKRDQASGGQKSTKHELLEIYEPRLKELQGEFDELQGELDSNRKRFLG
jgi:chromosome segregation ATPase